MWSPYHISYVAENCRYVAENGRWISVLMKLPLGDLDDKKLFWENLQELTMSTITIKALNGWHWMGCVAGCSWCKLITLSTLSEGYNNGGIWHHCTLLRQTLSGEIYHHYIMVSHSYHFLINETFSLGTFWMKPYAHRELRREQRHFSYWRYSKTAFNYTPDSRYRVRSIVESSFGQLAPIWPAF
jgi:hypothetical protein